jgi:polysaccharide export outer membrane protein
LISLVGLTGLTGLTGLVGFVGLADNTFFNMENTMKKKAFCILVLLLFAVSSAVALAKESTYHIGPGDVLEISVWKDASLSRQLIVPPDGVISFPLIGDIDVTNLSVPDLRKAVTQKLSEFVPDATVTVVLLQINSLRGYVIGKVNKPGEFPINMETNVMQILAMAGGMAEFASESKILILRYDSGKTLKIPFSYKEVKNGKNLEQNIILRHGDVVVVP